MAVRDGDRQGEQDGVATGGVALPAVRFDWLAEALPAGPWLEPLREALCAAIGSVGWPAVEQGEFGPLEKLYRDVASIYPRLLVGPEDIDRAADLYTLLHIMLWRRTQRLAELTTFNADVVLPFARFLSRHAPPRRSVPSQREVPRIAYLSETSELFGSNAVARITVSLMLGQQALRDEADWPLLYCINPPAASLWAFAREHRLKVRDLSRATPSRTAAAVIAQVEADGVDILVSDHNGAVATMVMGQRAATVQAFHENGYAPWAIPQLDLALLGITPPSPDLFDRRVVTVRTPRNTAVVFQNAPRPADAIEAVRDLLRTASGVAAPSTVYGVYGRMAKITDDYMAAVEAILLRDPQAIFFAGGTGRISPLLAREQASPAGRRMVIFNDFVDGHVIAPCLDVFLDTYPFPGGMSCIEVQARGVPVVWMAPSTDAPAIIADQRDPALRAADAAGYVDAALRLGDPAARHAHGETAHAIAARFGDMAEQAALVEGYLRDAWVKARRQARAAA